MKLQELITQVDALKPNAYDLVDKIGWVSRVESMIKKFVIDTHEGSDDVEFEGYTVESDPDTELIAPEPFDALYVHWLEAQIDYANAEYVKYNNAITTFNESYSAYQNWYNRNHMPLQTRIRYI